MMRILVAAVTAFVISAVVGWFLIPALRALHAGQSIKEIGPNWHKNKEGTPTMGGRSSAGKSPTLSSPISRCPGWTASKCCGSFALRGIPPRSSC